MITRKVVGIDPDTVLSGWCEAQIDESGHITHTLNLMSEKDIENRLSYFKSEGIAVTVAVENSWQTALGKSIPLTYNTKKPMSDYERAKIAGNVAVNHATGQRIAKLVEDILGVENLTYYYPNNGRFGKNPKYSQKMYVDICKAENIATYKRTNEEKRDAFRACLPLIDGLKSDYKRMIKSQSKTNPTNEA